MTNIQQQLRCFLIGVKLQLIWQHHFARIVRSFIIIKLLAWSNQQPRNKWIIYSVLNKSHSLFRRPGRQQSLVVKSGLLIWQCLTTPCYSPPSHLPPDMADKRTEFLSWSESCRDSLADESIDSHFLLSNHYNPVFTMTGAACSHLYITPLNKAENKPKSFHKSNVMLQNF